MGLEMIHRQMPLSEADKRALEDAIRDQPPGELEAYYPPTYYPPTDPRAALEARLAALETRLASLEAAGARHVCVEQYPIILPGAVTPHVQFRGDS